MPGNITTKRNIVNRDFRSINLRYARYTLSKNKETVSGQKPTHYKLAISYCHCQCLNNKTKPAHRIAHRPRQQGLGYSVGNPTRFEKSADGTNYQKCSLLGNQNEDNSNLRQVGPLPKSPPEAKHIKSNREDYRDVLQVFYTVQLNPNDKLIVET